MLLSPSARFPQKSAPISAGLYSSGRFEIFVVLHEIGTNGVMWLEVINPGDQC
jgi:hypothetical protein